MFLTAEVSLATPGALRTTTYFILFRIISSLTDSPVISQAWQKSWFLLSRADTLSLQEIQERCKLSFRNLSVNPQR